jgi:hypothetical protein
MKTELSPSRTTNSKNRDLLNKKKSNNFKLRETLPVTAPCVLIRGCEYHVDLGTDHHHRIHRVNKNKECSCGAPFCEAIDAVRLYLQAGGARAPDPSGLPPCPICGEKTYRDINWDGKITRDLGWRCSSGGLSHFLQVKTERIRKQFLKNPWLFPPAPGYPGVRRDELMTWETCERIHQQVFLTTGYDPRN